MHVDLPNANVIMHLIVIRDLINHNKNVFQAIVNIEITYLKGHKCHVLSQFMETKRAFTIHSLNSRHLMISNVGYDCNL